MIELGTEELCSVGGQDTCLDFKCPCLIQLNTAHYCSLNYFGVKEPQTAWYNTETDNLIKGERPNGDYQLAILRPIECVRNQTKGPDIELSATDKEALIHNLHLKWIAHLRYHPDDSWLDDTMVAYPNDPPEKWPVVFIPICNIKKGKIVKVHTTLHCFTPEVDNGETPVFSHKGIIEFLLAHKVEYVIGTVDRWNFTLDEQEGLPLCTIAARIDLNVGSAFEYFVGRFGGTLRVEKHYNWCIFRSGG